MMSYLPYIQVILSVIMVGLILLQHSDASAGAAFGSDNLGGTIHTRRGPEKILFVITVIIAVLFVLSSTTALFVK